MHFSDSGEGNGFDPNWFFGVAAPTEAAAVAEVRTQAAEALTRQYGQGPWSTLATPDGVLRNLQSAQLVVARNRDEIVGTLRLSIRKPWSIDATAFTPVRRPIYLTDMAVLPAYQHRGIGKRLLVEAADISRNWPGDAIRLDAYDAQAGAGGFYIKCGYREVGRAAYRGTNLIYFERML